MFVPPLNFYIKNRYAFLLQKNNCPRHMSGAIAIFTLYLFFVFIILGSGFILDFGSGFIYNFDSLRCLG